MMFLVTFSANESELLLNPVEIDSVSAVYEMACAIFRLLVMTFQYAVVKIFATVRHLSCFPSALQAKNLKVISRNVANLNVLPKCLSTAWSPESKTVYQEIGYAQGVRITHDIILRPASGLCLGKSLAFLGKYLLSEKGSALVSLEDAAKAVQGDSNETSVRLQAIYDALMGIEGKVQPQERDLFLQVLQGKQIHSQATLSKELLTSIETFLHLEESSDILRQFVLDDLERQKIEITPNVYALILELDTFWYLQQHPSERKNDSVHSAIIEAVAHCLQIELINTLRMKGKIVDVSKQLEELEMGSYLIQFSNHSIACVKMQDSFALFDPNEGLALFDDSDQHEGIVQLLEYYGSHDSVFLQVIEFQVANDDENIEVVS